MNKSARRDGWFFSKFVPGQCYAHFSSVEFVQENGLKTCNSEMFSVVTDDQRNMLIADCYRGWMHIFIYP